MVMVMIIIIITALSDLSRLIVLTTSKPHSEKRTNVNINTHQNRLRERVTHQKRNALYFAKGSTETPLQ